MNKTIEDIIIDYILYSDSVGLHNKKGDCCCFFKNDDDFLSCRNVISNDFLLFDLLNCEFINSKDLEDLALLEKYEKYYDEG